MPKDGTIFEGDLKKDEGIAAEKEEFLESEEHAETSDEVESQMHRGEKEADVYTKEGREELMEDGQVAEWEEGFSEGAEQKGERATCAHCGKVLNQKQDETVEREIDHKIKWFCSNDCAEKYAAEHKA